MFLPFSESLWCVLSAVVAIDACVVLGLRRQAFDRLVGKCAKVLKRNRSLYNETTARLLAEKVTQIEEEAAATAKTHDF